MSKHDAAFDLLCTLRLRDDRRWGEAAAGFQLRDARAILDLDSPVRCHFVTRARGGSKTTDLAALVIVFMMVLLRPDSRLYAIASDLQQGQLLLDSLRGFATRTPALEGAFQFTADRAVATTNGSVFQVLPCDDPGLYGLRPDLMICDELGQWPDSPRAQDRFESVATALPKVDGRLVVITTPSAPGHWAHALLEHAREDPLWQVLETTGEVPWIDPARLEGERRRLSDSQYARLHLGQWTEPEDTLALLEDIQACVDPDLDPRPHRSYQYVIAVDLALVHDRTAAVVAHSNAQPDNGIEMTRIVVDKLKVWTPSRTSPTPLNQVEDWIALNSREYQSARVIVDAWQAAGMIQRLRARGIRAEEFIPSAGSVARLASNLHLLLRNHVLTLPNDPELIRELANVRLVEGTTPGQYRLDHPRGKHDDRAIAVGLAALSIIENPPRRGPRLRALIAR